MLPIRLAIALILLGGLVLFTVQNLSPSLPLVILGGSTLSLPLAVWIGGAIGAGAVTTLILSTLIGLSDSARRSRPRVNAFRAPRKPQPAAANRPPNRSSAQDDWETRKQPKDEWEDWEEPAPRANAEYRTPDLRDRSDEDWADWSDYAEQNRAGQNRQTERLDDLALDPEEYRQPIRTEFEAKQEPATRIQSGSIYSYSYNRSQEPADRRSEDERIELDLELDREVDLADAPPRRPGGVYDADYRVLTPPYQPDVPPAEDDWGFEEDELDQIEPDEPTERDRRPPA